MKTKFNITSVFSAEKLNGNSAKQLLSNRFIMDFKSENKYTVFFKDGTSFESSGKCEGIKKGSVSEEFKWVAFHIEKEVIMKNKTLSDILKIEYNLSFTDGSQTV